MANLRGDLVECGSDRSQCGHIISVAVTLNHLRRNRCRLQTQASANPLFQLRIQMCECAYRSGELAYAHLLRGAFKAGDVADGFPVPVGQLQTEGGWLGVDAESASDHRGVMDIAGRSGHLIFEPVYAVK